MTAQADDARESAPAQGADNVRIIRKAFPDPQQGQKTEGWFAVFPKNHATCDRKVLRGWFLRALLKHAAVKVGSGVTFDSIREKEKAYYSAGRPGRPTEIV
jgi:hypothetical protein